MKSIVLFVLFGSIAAHLRDKAHQIYIGSALSPDHLQADAKYKSVAAEEFNCLTPENQMKWDAIESNRGHPNYGPADQLVQFAKQHNMKVRGHTLIWHQQVPNWLNQLDKNQLEQAMNTHIRDVTGHFKGQIYAWDVVNEVFNEDGTLRDSIWHRNFGENFIAEAFKTAHASDPNAKLYINDYNIESKNRKSDGLYNLVKKLKSEGVPVHGVGFQAHLQSGHVPGDLASNMKRFSDLGLDVAITELDLKIQKPVDQNKRQQQANDYVKVVEDCLSVQRCVGVTVWGFADKYSWLRSDQSFGEPCLWDDNYNPHLAVSAIEKVLR